MSMLTTFELAPWRAKVISPWDDTSKRSNIEIGGEGVLQFRSLVAIYLPSTVPPPGSSLDPSGTNVCLCVKMILCVATRMGGGPTPIALATIRTNRWHSANTVLNELMGNLLARCATTHARTRDRSVASGARPTL